MFSLYKITNKLNQKYYIGQSLYPEKRWKQHQNYAKRNHPEMYIHRAMAKYGIENFTFEVIAGCKLQEDANEAETIIINQFDSRNPEKGYNIKPGGETWDDESKKFMSAKMKEFYRNHPEARVRVSEFSKNIWSNPEHVAMMRQASTGRSNPMKGKKLSEEAIAKIKAGLVGKPRNVITDETRAKIAKTKASFSKEKLRELAQKIAASRGQIVLKSEQELAIINDPRPSRIVAKEYKVHPTTIQRIRKRHNCSFPVGKRTYES